VKHLRWVSNALRPTQKTEHAALSIEFLRQLPSIKHQGWQFIITLDESWFYFSTDHEEIWLRVEEQPPEGPRHTIQDPKNNGDYCMESIGISFTRHASKKQYV
jgi:hypothetical protein